LLGSLGIISQKIIDHNDGIINELTKCNKIIESKDLITNIVKQNYQIIKNNFEKISEFNHDCESKNQED